MADLTNPDEFLPKFGLTSFRPGQRDVIMSVLEGLDCLCIMPTGGGKSLCYQLPSLAREGVTLVVSPLIALMKDQVDGLQQRGIRANFINSSIGSGEQEERLMRFAAGEYDLLYVAPERFRSPRFLDVAKKIHVQLLAVDEAHCISEWGHDFRHDYARLGEFRARLGNPQTIALTATATQDVREDVIQQLRLESPKIFVAGFARDNLYYQVQHPKDKADKKQALLDFLEESPGTGIVYSSTRAACEEIQELISTQLKRPTIAYHAGLLPDDRRRCQDEFMSGKAEIVVATNAFGMGIDKPDVRFVIHYNLPGSLEAYYQEAGRAGRDGLPSRCVLFFNPSDRYIQEFFIDSAHPTQQVIQQVYEYLCRHPDDPIELTQKDLKEQIKLSIGPEGVGTCERLLEKAGILERLDSHRNMAAVKVDTNEPQLAELISSQAQSQRKVLRAIGHLIGTQRFERTYFHLLDVMQLSGLDQVSVTRALRELSRLSWFDYVPPFRGRAVHILKRNVPFDKLDIDFARLEERRRYSNQKLDRMIKFATTRRCRQQDILQYFGDLGSRPCGHCDNCGIPEPVADGPSASKQRASPSTPSISAAMWHAARIGLSGVARARGRFGKGTVVALLCGSTNAKVSRWSLQHLPTFGKLSKFRQAEVSQIVDALVELDLVVVEEVDRFRPVLRTSELGREVMRGNAPLPSPLPLPPSLVRKIEVEFRNAPIPISPIPIAPAASPHPAQGESASEVGDGEASHFNEDQECNSRDESPAEENTTLVSSSVNPDSDPVRSSRVAVIDRAHEGPKMTAKPSYYWTWQLLAGGYSPQDCCEIRRITPRELVDQLRRAQEEGWQVDPSWIVEIG